MKRKTKIAVAAFVVVLLALFLPYANSKIYNYCYPDTYLDTVRKTSSEFELDPYLVMALIKSESNFVVDATSKIGAKGLMQLTPSTAEWIAAKIGLDNYDDSLLVAPEYNIKIGCFYLSYLLDYYDGNENLALCAYNAGPGRVDEWLADENISHNGAVLNTIPYTETRNYIKRIEKSRQIYQKLYQEK